MQSIQISDILRKFKSVIKDDLMLTAFTQEKYGKAPFLFVGGDLAAPPNESTMPHIVILPGEDPSKEEGAERGNNHYFIGVAWAVHDEQIDDSEENSCEFVGLYNCDRMGQLIWESLREFSANCPASMAEYTVYGAGISGVYAGTMLIQIDVPTVMGAEISI